MPQVAMPMPPISTDRIRHPGNASKVVNGEYLLKSLVLPRLTCWAGRTPAGTQPVERLLSVGKISRTRIAQSLRNKHGSNLTRFTAGKTACEMRVTSSLALMQWTKTVTFSLQKAAMSTTEPNAGSLSAPQTDHGKRQGSSPASVGPGL